MKKLLCIIILLMMSPLSFADTDVEVVIPEFKVVLNDSEVNSTEAQYPMIQYNGVTYVPMTWDMCQSLGLIVKYSSDEGLSIKLGNTKGMIKCDQNGNNAKGS